MRPSWPAPMMPIFMLRAAARGSGCASTLLGLRRAERLERRADLRMLCCRGSRPRAAPHWWRRPCRSPACRPGMPAGICTIDSSESMPFSVFDCTGTPSTGSEVLAAVMPGRCAAPPAPAMMTSRPRSRAVAAYSNSRSGVRWAETTRTSCGTPSFSSVSAAGLQRLPVGGRPHDDANERFHRGIVAPVRRQNLVRARSRQQLAQPAEQLPGRRRRARGRAARPGPGGRASAVAAGRLARQSAPSSVQVAGSSASSRSRQRSIACSLRTRCRSRSRAARSASRIGSASILRSSLPMYSSWRTPRAVAGDAAARRSTASRRSSGRSARRARPGAARPAPTPRSCRSRLWRLSSLLLGGSAWSKSCGSLIVPRNASTGRAGPPAAARMPGLCNRCSRTMAIDRPHAPPSAADGADLLALVELALEEARALGATQAEAAVSIDVGLSVSARLGEVETVEYQRDRGMGVTVYFGTRKGSASTADLSAAGAARDGRQGLQHRALHGRGSLRGPAGSRHARDGDSRSRPVPSLGHHAGARLRAGDCVRGRGHGGRRAHHQFRRRRRQHASRPARVRQFATASSAAYPGTVHSLSCVVLGADGERDGARLLVQRPRATGASSRDAESVGRASGERAVRRLGARKLATMKVPVLFAPEVARGLIGHFLGAIRGGSQYRRASFLLDAAGQQVFPDWFAISERPHLPRRSRARRSTTKASRRAIASWSRAACCSATCSARTPRASSACAPPATPAACTTCSCTAGAATSTAMLGADGTRAAGDRADGAGRQRRDRRLLARRGRASGSRTASIAYPVHEVTIAGNLKDMYRQHRRRRLRRRRARRHPHRLDPVEQMTVAGD